MSSFINILAFSINGKSRSIRIITTSYLMSEGSPIFEIDLENQDRLNIKDSDLVRDDLLKTYLRFEFLDGS